MPHALPVREVVAALRVDPDQGLAGTVARSRLKRMGPNRLRQPRTRSAWVVLVDQFHSLIVALLVVALLLALVARDWPEAAAIGVVIAINGAIGFVSELRALRSMEALRRLGRASATVRRDGTLQRVAAESLVPGDIVVVEGGDLVTADLRLLEASKLQADESVMTGESTPVDKAPEPVARDAVLADRACMLLKGTAVTRGSGTGAVVATGGDTELGRIAELVEEGIERGDTPLERRLDALGRRLVWLTVLMAVLVAIAGVIGGRPLMVTVKTAIALAVAAVPEGLPIVATLALARGMWRMARRHALIRRLPAVETLGATTVICADKTGTLTENRMAVVRIALAHGDVEIGPGMRLPHEASGGSAPGASPSAAAPSAAAAGPDEALSDLLRACVLCNNAEASANEGDRRERVGDPMELALLDLGHAAGMSQAALRESWPELREVAFDPATKMMATLHADRDTVRVLVKGAPEAVLAASTSCRGSSGAASLDREALDRESWLRRNEELAGAGLRVLAIATRAVDSAEAEPFEGLELLGLVALVDPPRAEVRAALASCRDAGIRVVMVTGDHAATASYVAKALGLVEDDRCEVVEGGSIGRGGPDDEPRLLRAAVLARMDPAQKLDLVRLYQQHGETVAMTGDGVNDAPALKSADIGIAMGLRGTEVAREAADMVLRDDAFATIVHAIEQGRVIFDNIRAFVCYLISCNISEIIVVLVAALVNLPLPMLPLQILFLNLVTDVFPAIALGFGEGDPGVMARPPRRPEEEVVGRAQWTWIGLHGAMLAAAVLLALVAALWGLGLDEPRAVTVSFLTLAFAQLWHVFNVRHRDTGVLLNEVTRNPFVWAALALCTALILMAVHVGPVARVLETEDPGASGWGIVVGCSLLPLVVGQAALLIRSRLAGAERPAGSER